MKIDILDKNGKAVEKMDLSPTVFGVKPNSNLLAQYVRVYLFNQRQGTSSTKTRGEVSGGGKKPWRQKGTGRARVGSSRNPLWRHGGISHGPRPRSWNRKLTKKMRKLALASALSSKASKNDIVVINELKMKGPNTKNLLNMLDSVKALDRRTLLVLDKNDLNIRKSAGNIKGVETSLVDNLNTYDVLVAKKIVFSKGSVEKLQQKYAEDAKETVNESK